MQQQQQSSTEAYCERDISCNENFKMHGFLICLILICVMPGLGFVNFKHAPTTLLKALKMSKLDIQSRDGIIVTDALQTRINAKIGKVLDKLSAGVMTKAHVVLKLDAARDLTKNKHESGHACEVVCQMKGGDVVKSAIHTTSDMYVSIDLASHSLAQNLKKYRQKVKDHRSRPKIGGKVAEDEVDEDDALFSFDEAQLLAGVPAEWDPSPR